MKWAALAAIPFAVALLADCKPSVAPPNVLLLVMDTTRADRCSFLGYERPTTPRLAEFAKDAVVFTDAWSPAGWTGPAHASLFTGLRPEHHGFHDGDRNYLGTQSQTLAEAFSAAGYATGCFTNNDWVAPEFGLTRGFAKFEPMYRVADREYPWARRTHALAADWAEEQARAGRPFFLFINDMEPHVPYAPPEEDERRFVRGNPDAAEIAAARAFDFPRTVAYSLHAEEVSADRLALLSDLYDAEIAALDREIGVLFDRLAEDGLLDSMVVVVVGDHGEYLGEHHVLDHGHGLHRVACHVPLLVRRTGAFDGGRSVASVARVEDVSPTILELCGLPAPADIDGVSLTHDLPGRIARSMQGPNPGRRAWFQAIAPKGDVAPWLAGIDTVYDGRFHLLSYTDGRVELYDVTRDPGESDDISKRSPQDVDRLGALVRAAH